MGQIPTRHQFEVNSHVDPELQPLATHGRGEPVACTEYNAHHSPQGCRQLCSSDSQWGPRRSCLQTSSSSKPSHPPCTHYGPGTPPSFQFCLITFLPTFAHPVPSAPTLPPVFHVADAFSFFRLRLNGAPPPRGLSDHPT